MITTTTHHGPANCDPVHDSLREPGSDRGQQPARRRVTVSPHPQSTTARLDLVDLHDPTGERARQRLVRKDLSGRHDQGRRVMPSGLRDPAREPWVYANVLEPAGWGARMYGRWRTPTADWLLLEHVDGIQLRYTDDPAAWAAAGRWLGRFHASVDPRVVVDGPLLRVDEQWFAGWMARAIERHIDGGEGLLAMRTAIRRCTDVLGDNGVMASTMLHGDFHPANVLVAGRCVTPVDWELAAIGDPAHDLGCLLSGDLTVGLQRAVLNGYLEARPRLDPSALGVAVVRARLRLCVQWLGWSDTTGWRPPAGQRTAWSTHGENLARSVLDGETP